jgi:EmrB/QacA subfamily drug resistance transporter
LSLTENTAAPANLPAPPPSGELSRRNLIAIISGLLMATLLSSLDQTVVVTAMRTIADDLSGLRLQAWVTTAYLITTTVSIPLYGKFGDLYGRRRVMLTAMAVFVAGSALCGLAGSMYALAGARAIQGIGAGGLLSIVVAVIGDIVPAREQARYQAYFIPVYAVASLLGPLVGGFFAGHAHLLGITGWRWAFLINLPIGIAALAVVAKVLRIPHTPVHHRIDWLGAGLLLAAAVPVLTVLTQGRDWGWGSARVLGLSAMGVLALVAFVLVERRMGDDALLPASFFASRAFTIGTAVCLVIGAGMLGVLVTLPLYLQIAKGGSPTQAGLMLLSLTIAMMLGSGLCGRFISATGRYKIIPVVGSGLMVVGLLLFRTITVDTPLWLTGCYMAGFGVGLGFCTQPLTLAVQNSLPSRHMGVATGSAMFARQIGGTIGTAVLLSVLFSTVRDRITDALHAASSTSDFAAALHDPAVLANSANRPVLEAAASGSASGLSLDDTSFLAHVDPRLARPLAVGFSESMSWVFLVGAAVVLVGFVLLLFLRETPLATTSALATREYENQRS